MMGFQRVDAKWRILEIGRRLISVPDLTNTHLLLVLCFGHPQHPPVETMGGRGPLYTCKGVKVEKKKAFIFVIIGSIYHSLGGNMALVS